MQIDTTTWRSPNHSSRDGHPITMLVWHATVGAFSASARHLCNPAPSGDPRRAVSTHYLIRKDGYTAQLVDDTFAAWHAGASFWRGMGSQEIQRASIGIELENANDGRDPYPAAQLDAAVALGRQLLTRHIIPPENITRHKDIAIPAGRKTDPAGLDWPVFLRRLIQAPALTQRYRIIAPGTILEAPGGDEPIALANSAGAWLVVGGMVDVDVIKPGGWAHLADGRGFVPFAYLEEV